MDRDPAHIAAILVKTEGNGGVNNFTGGRRLNRLHR
jgi:hypothetical protein